MSKNDMVPDAWLVTGPGTRGAYVNDPTHWAHGYSVVPLYARSEQHQGEPVAWTWQGSLDTLRGYCPAGVAVFPHKSPGTPIPLYTHPAAADHDEVEQLRAELAQMTTFRDNAANHMRRIRAEATAFEKERDTLRANLAEAHELLSEALRSVHADAEKSESSVAVDELEELASRIDSALSSSAEPIKPQLVECDSCPRSGGCVGTCMKAPASAEPSALVEIDERAEFEKWYLAEYYEGDAQCGLEWLSTEPCGGYRYSEPGRHWKVWQARAALARKP